MEQEEVWDNIAPEWHQFKTEPSGNVVEFLKDKKGKILDLGSGSGRNFINVKTQAEVYFLDFSAEMLKLAKQTASENKIKAKFFQAEAHNLPFEDNYFDSIVSVFVLHCIPDKQKREKTIKEMFRTMKPTAEAIIGVWNWNSKFFKNSPKERQIKWRDKGSRYYYLYENDEIINLFKKAGFKIIKSFEPSKNIIFIVRKC